MTDDATLRKITNLLTRAGRRVHPAPPTILVSGPRIDRSVGDPNEPFYIASIDKVFVATLVAQLFDDGLCSPETPIGELLPAADLAPLPAMPGVENGRAITVEHLLSHTSGLPDVLDPPRGHRTACSIVELKNAPERVWTPAALLQQAAHLPPVARPGERFQYGDTAYLLLIRIIEELRETTFGEQLRTRVFEPCEMADSAEWVDADADAATLSTLVPQLAPFWIGKPDHDIRQGFASNLTWASGLGGPSTARDLVRFQTGLLRLWFSPGLCRQGDCFLHYGFELDRGEFPEPALTALAVIDPFDPLHDRQA